jgi:dihydrofolate reductase
MPMTASENAKKPCISVVVAVGRDQQHNHVIGKDNKLLWHIPDDLKRFKEITLGHPVVMGRKTFESILAELGRPLPGRTNIVVTRDAQWNHPGVEVYHSLQAAFDRAAALDQDEIFIGGGTQLYTEAFPQIDRIYLTIIDAEAEGDAFFPDYAEFKEVSQREEREWNGLHYTWVTLER